MASIACIVLIETDDPRFIDPEIAMRTVEGVAALRQTVIDNLPKLTRVVAVMPEIESRLMLMAHARAAEVSGLRFILPTKDYVSPADKRP